MPIQPGQLRDRLIFQRRGAVKDQYGNDQIGPWEDVVTVAARVTVSPGRETVAASRLQGVNPVDVWVRYSSDTAGIRTEWRALDARDSCRVFAILSITDPEEYRGQYRLLSCTLGGAS